MFIKVIFYNQVTVTAREDVPYFGPPIPQDGIFSKVYISFINALSFSQNRTEHIFYFELSIIIF
jgi:hypothetical protein